MCLALTGQLNTAGAIKPADMPRSMQHPDGAQTYALDDVPLLDTAGAIAAERNDARLVTLSAQRARTPDLRAIRPTSGQFDNSGWEPNLAFPGSLQKITTVAAAGRYVYIGMFFGNEIGQERLDGKIARWDGERWISLGDKLTGAPNAMFAVGDDLYIAGGFEGVAGKDINGVAKYSGATGQWSAIGSGVGPSESPSNTNSPSASDIVVVNGVVYIAGEFEKVDGVTAFNVAKFDGAAWSAIGNGFYYEPTGSFASVHTLDALPDGRILVGGEFTHFYTNPTGNAITPARGVALWNPAISRFENVGGLTAPGGSGNPIINDILAINNGFIIAGKFDAAGGVTVNGIAKWTASGWSGYGSGLGNGSISQVALYGNVLFAGGSFGTIGGVGSHRIAKWDGAKWVSLDSTDTSEDHVAGVAVTSDGNIYTGGEFDRLGGLNGNNIVRYSEPENLWRTVGEGLADGSLAADVNALHVLPDGRVIAGGDFGSAGGKTVENLAIWDPVKHAWASWGGGANGSVNVITRVGNLLYFGGGFTRIGGIGASYFAIYDLTTAIWRAPGPLNGAVFAIQPAHDGLMYVGGRFDASPAGPTAALVLYNPATDTWVSPPFNFDGPGIPLYVPTVFGFLPDADGALIVGAFFRLRINGSLTSDRWNSLLYWNRKTGQLTRYNNGATDQNDTLGSIYDVTAGPGGQIFFGGQFTRFVTGIAANNAARLSGTSWLPMGLGVNSSGSNTPKILAMALAGSCLFVGGDFFSAGNTTSRRAAVWNVNANDWQALGDGIAGGDIDQEVRTITVGQGQVFFGGEFWYAGDGQAGSFAVWNLTPRVAAPTPAPENPALTRKLRLPLTSKAHAAGGLGACQ